MGKQSTYQALNTFTFHLPDDIFAETVYWEAKKQTNKPSACVNLVFNLAPCLTADGPASPHAEWKKHKLMQAWGWLNLHHPSIFWAGLWRTAFLTLFSCLLCLCLPSVFLQKLSKVYRKWLGIFGCVLFYDYHSWTKVSSYNLQLLLLCYRYFRGNGKN